MMSTTNNDKNMISNIQFIKSVVRIQFLGKIFEKNILERHFQDTLDIRILNKIQQLHCLIINTK